MHVEEEEQVEKARADFVEMRANIRLIKSWNNFHKILRGSWMVSVKSMIGEFGPIMEVWHKL